MIIDTHTHLFKEVFKEDFNECLKRAKENNVLKMILVGYSLETSKLAYEFAQKYECFYNTAAIHPSEVKEDIKGNINELEEFIKTHKVYAIGECGLDYHYEPFDKELQKAYFEEQIKLAIKYDLPISVHMRDATQDTYELLLKYKGRLRGVMHCYSGSYEMAMNFLKLGFYISLGGPVTFKNGRNPKEVAAKIDLNCLLVETDSPYLAPTPFRGTRNESAYVLNVVDEIAKIRGLTREEVSSITTNNAVRLFNL